MIAGLVTQQLDLDKPLYYYNNNKFQYLIGNQNKNSNIFCEVRENGQTLLLMFIWVSKILEDHAL